MKFSPVSIFTGYRDAMNIEDAVKHHDIGHLGGYAATALLFLLGLLKGSRYANYIDWITPEVAGQIGSILAAVAAASFGWGHFAGNAVMAAAAVAGQAGGPPAGVGAALGAQMGSGAALSDASVAVRTDAGSVVEQRATAVPVGGPGTENGGP